MFQLQSASLSYGGLRALSDLNLTIEKGEQVCLIGPSGAGKTSLLGLLNGRVFPSQGKVEVDGQSLADLRSKGLQKVRRDIAWIPQDLGLVPTLRVNQNVASGRVAQKGSVGLLRSLLVMSGKEKQEIHELLLRLGIEEKLFAKVAQLSGGQQQRVAIARALYQQPQAILADEPVSAVDPERARDLIELLTSVARAEGLTVVTSLHDVALARRYFDRIIGLRAGEVVFDGTPSEEGLQNLYRLQS